LGHGKSAPLFLDEGRVKAIEGLWLEHQVATQIIRTRSSSERVIRNNFY
jgi:hypothetical protein